MHISEELASRLGLDAHSMLVAMEMGELWMDVPSAPGPWLPQMLRKAGISILCLPAYGAGIGSRLPGSFAWQGIDGTRVEVRINDTSPELPGARWYGALPESGVPVIPQAFRPSQSGFLQLLAGLECPPDVEIPEDDAGLLATLGRAVDTRGMRRPVLVLNNLSQYANEVVCVPIGAGENPVTAIGPEGEAVPVQIQEHDAERYALFVPKNVPLHGYAVWDLGATLIPAEPEDTVEATIHGLENSSIRVELDSVAGCITRIQDIDGERELLGETVEVARSGKRTLILPQCANRLFGKDGAPAELQEIAVIEAGPVRGGLRLVWKLAGSGKLVYEKVTLSAGSTRLDFTFESDGDSTTLEGLRVALPFALNPIHASCEVPCGYIEAPTLCNEPNPIPVWAASRWLDLSEGSYGVSALTNCGSEVRFDFHGAELDVTLDLSRGPAGYSIYAHSGSLQDGEVVDTWNAICSPPSISALRSNQQGRLPLERSYIELDNASVFIDAIYSPNPGEVIVRMHEACNTRGEVLLTTHLPVKEAWLCDLQENSLVEIPVDNDEALVPVHPFEIITVKYQLDKG